MFVSVNFVVKGLGGVIKSNFVNTLPSHIHSLRVDKGLRLI